MVPGGRSAAAAMSATASLPASAADSNTTTRSSANSDGLSNSASSLVLTSPARSRSTGTSTVPASSRADRSTSPTDRSTSSSSSPSTRCSWLTLRSCHVAPTAPVPGLTPAPATAHAIRHTAADATPTRPHRHRHTTTEPSPTAATQNAPAGPDGTGTTAPGTADAHLATRSSHHNSGPVKRTKNCAAAGHTVDTAAAPVPITVMGAMTTATARFAAIDTRLTVPDIPATSGAVTSWAATATLTASARGLGQPRSTSRRDHTGAITTSAAVADADSAKPMSTASWGAPIIRISTVVDSAGIACRRRWATIASRVMAPITAARSTLADGCTTTTNAARAIAAMPTATRGPTTAAVNRTAPQTMVTLAPDTAVR